MAKKRQNKNYGRSKRRSTSRRRSQSKDTIVSKLSVSEEVDKAFNQDKPLFEDDMVYLDDFSELSDDVLLEKDDSLGDGSDEVAEEHISSKEDENIPVEVPVEAFDESVLDDEVNQDNVESDDYTGSILLDEDDEKSVDLESSSLLSSYFDDDAAVLKYYDEAVHETTEMAIIKQDENIISWEVDNLFDENGQKRSKFALRNDPPVFKISSGAGDEAQFVVTKELARTMGKLFNDIHRAYHGIEPKEVRRERWDDIEHLPKNIGEWFMRNKVKGTIFILLVILIFVAFTF